MRKAIVTAVMRDTIFEAAGSVLEQHGVGGMTMDRVASEAGMAKASLYHYFGGKRDLLEFVYTKTVDPIFQDLDEVVATEEPATEKLARHLRQRRAARPG